MTLEQRYAELVTLPRAVKWPVELLPPSRFDPERLESWPHVEGRLEFYDGKLLYMPPCSDRQQDTVSDVVVTLGAFVRRVPGFVLGTNEAGMRLGGATRAADAALWRQADLGGYTGGVRRVPPVLAVEVVGEDDGAGALREKARWYLSVGVAVVWLVDPAELSVTVIDSAGERRFAGEAQLPAHAELPGLTPSVRELFFQLSRQS